jgi:hypothetical protein
VLRLLYICKRHSDNKEQHVYILLVRLYSLTLLRQAPAPPLVTSSIQVPIDRLVVARMGWVIGRYYLLMLSVEQ